MTIAGRLGDGFLPGPRDQEPARPARQLDRGQGRALGVGEHETRERLRVAVAPQRVRAAVKLLDVDADRGPRDGNHHEIARMRHGMLKGARAGLAVR